MAKQLREVRQRQVVLLKTKNGSPVEIPLVHEEGRLQGAFEAIDSQGQSHVLRVYCKMSGKGLVDHLAVVNEQSKEVGLFSGALSFRHVGYSYRRMGLASYAFDLLESQLIRGGEKEVSLTTRDLEVVRFLEKRGYALTRQRPLKRAEIEFYLKKSLAATAKMPDLKSFHRMVVMDPKTGKEHTVRLRIHPRPQ